MSRLCLPSLYWSRVCPIFEDAEVTKAEMQRMIDAAYACGPSAFGTVGARMRESVPAASAGTDPGGETQSNEAPNSRQAGLAAAAVPRGVDAAEHVAGGVRGLGDARVEDVGRVVRAPALVRRFIFLPCSWAAADSGAGRF